ncbi:MAG: hypothetical protein QY318_00750 [Candidatus Dojkabacteria bacterium]|nr:MAG: hypothetical protein QY318_00750 [Candidatus Dojkabacteria bacterium]
MDQSSSNNINNSSAGGANGAMTGSTDLLSPNLSGDAATTAVADSVGAGIGAASAAPEGTVADAALQPAVPATEVAPSAAGDVETAKPSADAAPTKEEQAEKDHIEKINSGGGINLVPTLSKGEKQVIEKKSRFNFAAAFFILLLVIVSIAVVGFNIITKFQLNRERDQTKELEAQILDRGDVVRSNNELLDRISLYKNVQESTLSPREILLYWQELTADYGQIQEVEMKGGVKFTFRGTSNSLNDVAILWHKLSIDERVTNINLESVSKGEDGVVSYNFEGDLNADYFISEKANQ